MFLKHTQPSNKVVTKVDAPASPASFLSGTKQEKEVAHRDKEGSIQTGIQVLDPIGA